MADSQYAFIDNVAHTDSTRKARPLPLPSVGCHDCRRGHLAMRNLHHARAQVEPKRSSYHNYFNRLDASSKRRVLGALKSFQDWPHNLHHRPGAFPKLRSRTVNLLGTKLSTR